MLVSWRFDRRRISHFVPRVSLLPWERANWTLGHNCRVKRTVVSIFVCQSPRTFTDLLSESHQRTFTESDSQIIKISYFIESDSRRFGIAVDKFTDYNSANYLRLILLAKITIVQQPRVTFTRGWKAQRLPRKASLPGVEEENAARRLIRQVSSFFSPNLTVIFSILLSPKLRGFPPLGDV